MIMGLARRALGRATLKDELTSLRLRERFRRQGVEVGLYSYGCFDMGRISSGTTIGRYCSFSPTARTQTRNHGIDFIGLTAYFYEPALDVVDRNMIPVKPIIFEDDVWVGANAVILSSAQRIGRGSVIGAGAIVTKPVAPYSIVAGNPARVIRSRFDAATIDAIEQSRWWDMTPEQLRETVARQPEMIFAPTSFFRSGGGA